MVGAHRDRATCNLTLLTFSPEIPVENSAIATSAFPPGTKLRKKGENAVERSKIQ